MLIHASYARPLRKCIFISVAFISLFCSSYSGSSQEFVRNGSKVTYRGNTFQYSTPRTETVTVTDPVTRKEVTRQVTHDAVPVKMNDKKIYSAEEVTQKPVQVDESLSLQLVVLKGITKEFNKLPDGRYLVYLSNIIVDNSGKVVYYEYEGLASERSKVKIPDSTRKSIDSKIEPLVTKVKFKPGRMNTTPVIVRTDIDLGMFTVVVKNHKATVNRS